MERRTGGQEDRKKRIGVEGANKSTVRGEGDQLRAREARGKRKEGINDRARGGMKKIRIRAKAGGRQSSGSPVAAHTARAYRWHYREIKRSKRTRAQRSTRRRKNREEEGQRRRRTRRKRSTRRMSRGWEQGEQGEQGEQRRGKLTSSGTGSLQVLLPPPVLPIRFPWEKEKQAENCKS